MAILRLLTIGALAVSSFAATATGTQTLSANLGPIGKLSIVQPTVSLTHTGAIFQNFTGSLTVQYEVRTKISTGSSFITARAGGDFAPANGPSIASGDLTYACSGATLGTACSGTQTVSTTSQTNIVTIGAGACTGTGCAGSNPNSVTVNLNLLDSPRFKTGSYSTTLTLSISAL